MEGVLLELPDGKRGKMFKEQPLLTHLNDAVIIYLVDENNDIIINGSTPEKMLIKRRKFKRMMKNIKILKKLP